MLLTLPLRSPRVSMHEPCVSQPRIAPASSTEPNPTASPPSSSTAVPSTPLLRSPTQPDPKLRSSLFVTRARPCPSSASSLSRDADQTRRRLLSLPLQRHYHLTSSSSSSNRIWASLAKKHNLNCFRSLTRWQQWCRLAAVGFPAFIIASVRPRRSLGVPRLS